MLKGLTTRSNLHSFMFLSNSSFDVEAAHVAHVALFQDTLRLTNSPALAVQSLFTRVFQMIYYDYHQEVSSSTLAAAAFSSRVDIPSRWAGFTGVVAIMTVHLFLMAAAAILFCRFTAVSELGNLWQAVSQIITTDTLPVLDHARDMQDKEVGKLVETQYPELMGDSFIRRCYDGRNRLRTRYKKR